MNTDKLLSLWTEIGLFFERLFGWLNFVVGGGDDPFVFDGFWSDLIKK